MKTIRVVASVVKAAMWLKREELDSVEWLPADVTLVDKIRIEI